MIQLTSLIFHLFICFALGHPRPTLNDPVDNADVSNANDADFNFTRPAYKITNVSKGMINLNVFQYRIQLDGRNLQNWENFVTTGDLYITSGNRISGNANDLLFIVGSPVGNPLAGSIRFVTNGLLYKLVPGARAIPAVDYGRVTSAANSINVVVDPDLAPANSLSLFNARSGVTKNAYLVSSGRISLNIAGNAISGTLDLRGSDLVFSGMAPLQARISGTLIQTGGISI
jgi:hypothetical protein